MDHFLNEILLSIEREALKFQHKSFQVAQELQITSTVSFRDRKEKRRKI